jgi:hypothetical protein
LQLPLLSEKFASCELPLESRELLLSLAEVESLQLSVEEEEESLSLGGSDQLWPRNLAIPAVSVTTAVPSADSKSAFCIQSLENFGWKLGRRTLVA